jgi:hypothetical protein
VSVPQGWRAIGYQRHHDDAHWPSVRVGEHATGAVRHVTADEDTAFWEWAYV